MPPEFGESRSDGATTSLRSGGARAQSVEVRPVVAETIRATVLFVDLRGYTGLAERNDGQIFYMVGDGMMAGFGVRDSADNGAQNALAAAQAMLKSFAPIVV